MTLSAKHAELWKEALDRGDLKVLQQIERISTPLKPLEVGQRLERCNSQIEVKKVFKFQKNTYLTTGGILSRSQLKDNGWRLVRPQAPAIGLALVGKLGVDNA